MQGFRIDNKKAVYIHNIQRNKSLFWVKICALALSSIAAIWTILLFLANWSIFIHFIQSPTVHSVILFSACLVFMLYVLILLVLNILNVTNIVNIRIAREEMLVAFSTQTILMIIGLIMLLIWGFKTLSVSVNLSMILCVVYPILAAVVFMYTLYFLTEDNDNAPSFIQIEQKDNNA